MTEDFVLKIPQGLELDVAAPLLYPASFETLVGAFDLIVNTVSAPVDLDAYLSLLAADGTLVNVGAPPEPLSLSVFSVIFGRRSFAGSLIGGIRET